MLLLLLLITIKITHFSLRQSELNCKQFVYNCTVNTGRDDIPTLSPNKSTSRAVQIQAMCTTVTRQFIPYNLSPLMMAFLFFIGAADLCQSLILIQQTTDKHATEGQCELNSKRTVTATVSEALPSASFYTLSYVQSRRRPSAQPAAGC